MKRVEDLHLQSWEEVVGLCIKATKTRTGASVLLQVRNKKYRLGLPYTQANVKDLVCKRIAVVRSDKIENPFLIRIFQKQKSSNRG